MPRLKLLPSNYELRDKEDAFTGQKKRCSNSSTPRYSAGEFKGSDKKKSGNNAARYVLSLFDYENVDPEIVVTAYPQVNEHALKIIEK
jgi:hypothetical protein